MQNNFISTVLIGTHCSCSTVSISIISV